MCVFYIIFHIREIYLINKTGTMSKTKRSVWTSSTPGDYLK